MSLRKNKDGFWEVVDATFPAPPSERQVEEDFTIVLALLEIILRRVKGIERRLSGSLEERAK